MTIEPSAAPTLSFVLRNLRVLNYANGHTHWHYRCVDLASARATGFFAGVGDLITPGDTIVVSCAAGAMMGWLDDTGTIQPMEPVR